MNAGNASGWKPPRGGDWRKKLLFREALVAFRYAKARAWRFAPRMQRGLTASFAERKATIRQRGSRSHAASPPCARRRREQVAPRPPYAVGHARHAHVFAPLRKPNSQSGVANAAFDRW